jgi:hypothetical protein
MPAYDSVELASLELLLTLIQHTAHSEFSLASEKLSIFPDIGQHMFQYRHQRLNDKIIAGQ